MGTSSRSGSRTSARTRAAPNAGDRVRRGLRSTRSPWIAAEGIRRRGGMSDMSEDRPLHGSGGMQRALGSVTRRSLLRNAGVGVAGFGLASILAACGGVGRKWGRPANERPHPRMSSAERPGLDTELRQLARVHGSGQGSRTGTSTTPRSAPSSSRPASRSTTRTSSTTTRSSTPDPAAARGGRRPRLGHDRDHERPGLHRDVSPTTRGSTSSTRRSGRTSTRTPPAGPRIRSTTRGTGTGWRGSRASPGSV